jgi:hypothetical protein
MPNTYFRKNNIDVYEIYKNQARLRDNVVVMRGHFQAVPLNGYTYKYIFIPTDDGDLTQVVPVFEGCSIIDIVAYSNDVWGAVTGAASYLGTPAGRVYQSPSEWLAGDIGVLPLTKSFYQTLQ